MRHLLFFILSLSSVVALAQSDERVREIRAMYANTQEVLKDQSEDEAINWSLRTTLRHNEPAVGVVRYEHEYYPLALLGAYDFVRSKRYVTVNPPSSYEILYDNGEPVFYFERSNWGDDVYEYRIYWDKEGTVCEYVPQRIEDGRKVKVGYDGIEMWFRADQAYRFAMQEYKRGVEGYNTNGEGVPLRPKLKPQSREGLYQCVNQIYDAYFTPEAMEEPDPESEADIIGLGKMTSFVTEDFNQHYCHCSSKSIANDELFHDYDLWTNSQDLSATGLAGITIRQYTDSQAQVAVQLWNFEAMTTVVLQLVFDAEKSTWLVSDFIDANDGSSYMKAMHRFLAD